MEQATASNSVKKCATPFCRKVSGTRTHCDVCRARKYRINNPVRYSYTNLKSNARRRNIPFTITFDQFKDWCVKVTYIGLSGRSAESMTIDRRYNDIGYHIDNIRVLKKRLNILKYWHYDYRQKAVVVMDYDYQIDNTDNPF